MTISTELYAVETEIETIQSQANELLDQLQNTTRAEGKALKATPEWKVVERWNELFLQRAKLREALEIESIIGE